MSTQAQINANQINSQKSTGPVTETGKLNSSQNRRLHSLGGKFQVLPCESQAEFEKFLQSLDNEYRPASPSEALLVEHMAESCWTRDRALRLQQGTLDPHTGEIADEKKFALYQRYFTTHNNAFHKALNDLLKQRKQDFERQIGFDRESRKQEAHPFEVSLKDLEISERELKLGRPRGASQPIREAAADQIWLSRQAKAA